MADPTPRMSTRELLPLVALTLSAFLLNTSEFVPIGLLTDIAGAFSLSESGAGAMISIYAWAVALLSLPLMLAASRVPPRALIVSVLAVFCGGQVASALAPTFELLVASRLIVAAAHAVFWSVASPFAVRVAAPERSALAMSMIVTGTSVAMIFGLPLGRALGLALGWRMTFVCVGAAAAAALAGLIAFFPRLDAGKPFTLDRLPELARNRALMGLYLATILFATGYYTGYSYIEPFLQQVAAMPDALITAALTVFGVAGLVGSGLFARFFDAHRRPFLTATMLGMAAALLLLLPLAGVPAGPFAVCVIWGVSATAYNVAAQAEVIRTTSQAATPVAMSVFSGLFNVGIGTGSIVGGLVCDAAGPAGVGLVGGAVAAAGALYCLVRLGSLLEGEAQR
ncbi:MFS transporter [Thermophilibacter provencensis]|uniref:MFS transporter n=1 Tax=Thermophilibacter provencensis TaxID=1852386 RepID=A0A921GFF7_9ACTN|nr:MFS transporter [Thermophilibacter provencensis]HJF44894.1 MFS transporter [Thermophilibacter provencensis]